MTNQTKLPKGIELPKNASVESDPPFVGAFKIRFFFIGGETATIRTVFDDRDTGAEMVITHMTVEPEHRRNEGFGTRSALELIRCAIEADLQLIKVTQVRPSSPSRRFWERLGLRPDVGCRAHGHTFQHAKDRAA